MIEKIAIVGAGLAGVSAARTLRSEGYGGELLMVGEESHCPYDRPSLSKSVLAGVDDSPASLVEPMWFDEVNVGFLRDRKVSSLDLQACCLNFVDGSTIAADRILLATGSRPRKPTIPGNDLRGLHYLRTVDDSLAIRENLAPGMSVVIIGGGLIGCEVASTLRKAGANLVILETAGELLLRVLGPALGAWCRQQLEAQGIRIRCNANVVKIVGDDHVSAVLLEGGESVPADFVIVSIGAEPNVELATAAGIFCDKGIVVDATGQTSSPWIYAAGDAAAWPLRGGGRRSLETYLNAQSQAEVAARSMIGRAVETPQIPISWTEMAGHYIQMIGDLAGEGELMMRGDPSTGAFLVFRLVDERVTAAVAVDATRDFATARRFVEGEMQVAREKLRNTEINLRDLTRATVGA